MAGDQQQQAHPRLAAGQFRQKILAGADQAPQAPPVGLHAAGDEEQVAVAVAPQPGAGGTRFLVARRDLPGGVEHVLIIQSGPERGLVFPVAGRVQRRRIRRILVEPPPGIEKDIVGQVFRPIVGTTFHNRHDGWIRRVQPRSQFPNLFVIQGFDDPRIVATTLVARRIDEEVVGARINGFEVGDIDGVATGVAFLMADHGRRPNRSPDQRPARR
ncbi:MAG: hypothetical protein U5O69_01235 [Candidatus Competibacteraceae bacterium]|nr:hypothetical protein [Candidatus Competibacteraceae bacterium]